MNVNSLQCCDMIEPMTPMMAKEKWCMVVKMINMASVENSI